MTTQSGTERMGLRYSVVLSFRDGTDAGKLYCSTVKVDHNCLFLQYREPPAKKITGWLKIFPMDTLAKISVYPYMGIENDDAGEKGPSPSN